MDIHEVSDYEAMIAPISYRFRFTFTEQDKTHSYIDDKEKINRWKAITRRTVTKIQELYAIDKVTAGFETLNKSGERTWAHMHIHFTSRANKDSMSRTLKRFLSDDYNQETTGVKTYSFKADLMREPQKFWRYPLKQNLNIKLCHGFKEEELQKMHQVARDSYSAVVEINQKKMDNKDNTDTLFQRLTIYLKKSGHSKIYEEILVHTINFYKEEQRPINKNTIIGYTNTYMLLENIITAEDLIKSW